MESALYGIYALVVFVSEILLVRFLIRQQLVRKYRTPALSMKYSLFIYCTYLVLISVTRSSKFQSNMSGGPGIICEPHM